MSQRPATPSLLRSLNNRSALEFLIREGPLTRVGLGQKIGLSKVTASQLLTHLQELNLVEVVGTQSAGRGPNAELYAIRPGCAHSIGFELNVAVIKAAVADVTGTMIGRIERPLPKDADPKQVIHDLAVEVAAAGGVSVADIDDVVIGMPGVVDPVTGDIELSFDLPGWHRGLRSALATDLDCQVTFENDVNLAAAAERVDGAGSDVDNMVLLWVDIGVGLAVVLSGHLHRGATGAAGEIGYLPMPGVRGPARIDRPAEGAFQALVGASAVAELAKEHGIVADGPAEAIRTALAAGAPAEAFLQTFADRLALGMAAVCAVVDPAVVVIAGQVGAAGGEILSQLVAQAVRNIAPVHPVVVPTQIDDAPILRGAVLTSVDNARKALFDATI